MTYCTPLSGASPRSIVNRPVKEDQMQPNHHRDKTDTAYSLYEDYEGLYQDDDAVYLPQLGKSPASVSVVKRWDDISPTVVSQLTHNSLNS